jgi:hypothetical protein
MPTEDASSGPDDDTAPEPNMPSAEALSQRLGISEQRARDLIARYGDDLDALMKHVQKIT